MNLNQKAFGLITFFVVLGSAVSGQATPSATPPSRIQFDCDSARGQTPQIHLNFDLRPDRTLQDVNYNMSGKVIISGIPELPGTFSPNGLGLVKAMYFIGPDVLHPSIMGEGVQITELTDNCSAEPSIGCDHLVDYFSSNVSSLVPNTLYWNRQLYSCSAPMLNATN